MESRGRRVIAVCASWEDVENLNLVLDNLIRATEGTEYLPMCIAFDRSSIESRGEESIQEFLSVFEVPKLAGFLQRSLPGTTVPISAQNRMLSSAGICRKNSASQTPTPLSRS